jgi:hypothetical protein
MWRRRPADDDAGNASFVDVTPPADTEARKMQRNSTVLNIFSLIMFGGPVLRMTNLREVTVDRIVRKHEFEQYVNKMMAEWRDITLYVREQHFRSDLVLHLLIIRPGDRHLISERIVPDNSEC